MASTTTLDDVTLRVAVLRLGGGRTLLRERRSDGSERVTLVSRGGGGAGLGLGADVGIGAWVLGGRLDGAVELRGGRGRMWTLPSHAQADALVRALAARPAGQARGAPPPVHARPRARDPDVVFGDRGIATSVSGALERAGLSLEAEDLFTTRTDRRTGERTLVVRRRTEALGTLGLTGPLGAEGGARRDERAALVVDRGGRPVRLVVTGVRRAQGGVRLPGPLRSLVARSGLPLRRGHVVETERRLDLADPANLRPRAPTSARCVIRACGSVRRSQCPARCTSGSTRWGRRVCASTTSTCATAAHTAGSTWASAWAAATSTRSSGCGWWALRSGMVEGAGGSGTTAWWGCE